MLSFACVLSSLQSRNPMWVQNHLHSCFPTSKNPQKVKKSRFLDPREFCRGKMGRNGEIKIKGVKRSKNRSKSSVNLIKSVSTSIKIILNFFLTFFNFVFFDFSESSREAHRKASKTVKIRSIGHQMLSFACILSGLWSESQTWVQNHLHSRFPRSKKPEKVEKSLFLDPPLNDAEVKWAEIQKLKKRGSQNRKTCPNQV